jgi:hypothetical protein
MNITSIADVVRKRLNLKGTKGMEPAAIAAFALVNQNGDVVAYTNSKGWLIQPVAKSFVEDFESLDTTDQVAMILPSGLTAAGTTDALNLLYTPGGLVLGAVPLGAGQTLFPTIVAGGLDIEGDQTNDEGYELFSHFAGTSGRPFIIGKDAPFYLKVKLTCSDVSVIDTMLIGFRRAAVNKATYTDYADYAALGWNTSAAAALIKTLTGLNGTDVATSTTNTIADGVALTVQISVDGSGNVHYKLDAVTPGTLAVPLVTTAFQFDNGDPVIPFIHFLHGSSAACSVVINTFEVGHS